MVGTYMSSGVVYCNSGWRFCNCPDGSVVSYEITCALEAPLWNCGKLYEMEPEFPDMLHCDAYKNCASCTHGYVYDDPYAGGCMHCLQGYLEPPRCLVGE